MPKYSLTRKINLKRFFPEMEYESVDFTAHECETKEEAVKEVNDWIKEHLAGMQKKKEQDEKARIQKAKDEPPFMSPSEKKDKKLPLVSDEQQARVGKKPSSRYIKKTVQI